MAELEDKGLIDFETGDTTQKTGQNMGGGNSLTALVEGMLHGTYGGQISYAGSASNIANFYKDLAGNEAKLYARTYFSVYNLVNPATNAIVDLIAINYDASVPLLKLRCSIGTDGVVTLDRLIYKTSGGSGYEALSTVLNTAQTYCLELMWDYNGGSNTVQAWLDDSSLASKSSISQSTWQYATRGYFGTIHESGGTIGTGTLIHYDDCKMSASKIGLYAEASNSASPSNSPSNSSSGSPSNSPTHSNSASPSGSPSNSASASPSGSPSNSPSSSESLSPSMSASGSPSGSSSGSPSGSSSSSPSASEGPTESPTNSPSGSVSSSPSSSPSGSPSSSASSSPSSSPSGSIIGLHDRIMKAFLIFEGYIPDNPAYMYPFEILIDPTWSYAKIYFKMLSFLGGSMDFKDWGGRQEYALDGANEYVWFNPDYSAADGDTTGYLMRVVTDGDNLSILKRKGSWTARATSW